MNLEVLKQYFTYLASSQLALENNRNTLQLDKYNSFAFYKLIALKSQSQIDKTLIINFIKTFTYSFQVKQPHELINQSGYELVPPQENSNQDQLISKGVDLFINKWGYNGKIKFQDFCQFLKEDGQIPDKSKQLQYHLKKKFYQMIQDQIQNLLDCETFRKIICNQYKNIIDLFQMLNSDGIITINQIKNLYLMSGQRKNDIFYQFIQKRFQFPCDFDSFKKWFSLISNSNKYKQQTKIYFSSVKRKKNGSYNDDQFNQKFMTPNGKSAAIVGISSTKMTKADRLNSIKRSKIQVSRFTFDQHQDSTLRKNTVILADILAQQQRINELKRQLIYQQDYDLELIYERRGKQFEQLLNNRYGSCNFTSFVRYLVPQDFQHRYLAFIKYQKQNYLSQATQEKLSYLLDQQHGKQNAIKQWWQDVDKQVVFRGYCKPGDKSIPNQQMKKYFTQRQCKILFDRLDPNRTGVISFDNFY